MIIILLINRKKIIIHTCDFIINRFQSFSMPRVYPKRFWILFVFAFLSFNQCMFWFKTFSPIAKSTEIFYQITEATIDLLLNWV